jgi:hypothetical protein
MYFLFLTVYFETTKLIFIKCSTSRVFKIFYGNFNFVCMGPVLCLLDSVIKLRYLSQMRITAPKTGT